MLLFFAIVFAGVPVLLVYSFLEQLKSFKDADALPRFRAWLVKGMLAPIFLWIFFISGLCFPSLLPQIEFAKNLGNGLSAFANFAAVGVFTISYSWVALTLGWLLCAIAKCAADRPQFYVTAALFTLFLLPIAFCIFHFMGWNSVGLALTIWFSPIVYCTQALAVEVKMAPSYSRALAKMQFGKYEDAEVEVIHELEKQEDDFDGWMMLAEIYANHFNDLPAAERTIHEICSDPKTTVSQISVALHRLADWQLHVTKDPAVARRSLEEICRRLPGTHLDRMARLRINQLPRDKAQMIEGQKVKAIPLLSIGRESRTARDPNHSTPSREESIAQANRCVEKLKKNPNDVAARVELAKIFAERLDKVELAIEQINLLIAMPGCPEKKASEWLVQVADWQIFYRHNEKVAMEIFERIVRDYPQTLGAFTAQRRLAFLQKEFKIRAPRL